MNFDRAFQVVVFSATCILLSVAAGTVVGLHQGKNGAAGGQTVSSQSKPPRVAVNISGDSGVSYVGAVGTSGRTLSAEGKLGDQPDDYDLGQVRDADTVKAIIRRTDGDGKLAVTILVDSVPAVAGQSSGDSYEAVDIQWFYQDPQP